MRAFEHLVGLRRGKRACRHQVEPPGQIAYDRPGLRDLRAVLGHQHGKLAEGCAALGIGPWLAEILPAHHVTVGLIAVMEHHLRCLCQRPHLEIDECQVSHVGLLR